MRERERIGITAWHAVGFSAAAPNSRRVDIETVREAARQGIVDILDTIDPTLSHVARNIELRRRGEPPVPWEPPSRTRLRLTDEGRLAAENSRSRLAEAARRQNGREEAVLAALLRWARRDGAGDPPTVVTDFIRPSNSPAVRGVRISLNEAVSAAEQSEARSLVAFNLATGQIELTGYGDRCVTRYGGDYLGMANAERPGDSIRIENGIVVTGGNSGDVSFHQSIGRESRGVEAQLAARLLELVSARSAELPSGALVERDAREIATELNQPAEAQDRDRVRDALTRLQSRVVGVDVLVLAAQELWQRLFG